MVWHVRGIPIRGWGLVVTKPKGERVALVNLQRQGVRCFMPKARIQGTGQLQALFPGYLFVQIPERWGFIANTRGVSRILMAGDRPGLVQPVAMRLLLKSLNDENFIDMRPGPPPKLATEALVPGEAVKITLGVFKNLEAVYKALAPHERIRVVTEFMGQQTEVELDRAAIVRQGKPEGKRPAGAVASKGQGNAKATARKR